jgi:putative membrane protein
LNPAAIAISVVALEHLYFMVLEMFLWQTPLGLQTFHNTAEFAQKSAPLAANQGLYNGFLAAGLLFSLVHPAARSRAVRSFFLGCVVVAGIYGALTAIPSIFFIQALPALIALALLLGRRQSRE